jgi:hypothetical protein
MLAVIPRAAGGRWPSRALVGRALRFLKRKRDGAEEARGRRQAARRRSSPQRGPSLSAALILYEKTPRAGLFHRGGGDHLIQSYPPAMTPVPACGGIRRFAAGFFSHAFVATGWSPLVAVPLSERRPISARASTITSTTSARRPWSPFTQPPASERERALCRERLAKLTGATLDCDALRYEVVAVLKGVLGFDRWAWPLADPETLITLGDCGARLRARRSPIARTRVRERRTRG